MKRLYTLLLALMGISLGAVAEDYVLPVERHDDVVYYTNPAFSQEGAYDYYFYFDCNETESNPMGMPIVAFDLLLPENKGLEPGVYTTATGRVFNEVVMILNDTDYMLYQNGYLSHADMDVTVTLERVENGGPDDWTVTFYAIDGDDTYTFTQTGRFAVVTDDTDPYDQQFTYRWEPTTATEMDITFDAPQVYDYTSTYGILLVELDTDQTDANGLNYQSSIYIVSDTPRVPAALYPINFTQAEGTVIASPGCTLDGSTDYPSYLRTYDAQHIYDTWYLIAGYINVTYDAQNAMALEGFAESYNGSHLTFRTANHASIAGLGTVLADAPATATRKQLRDGRFEIRHAGRSFDALGIRR